MVMEAESAIHSGLAYTCRDGTVRWVLEKHMAGQSEMVVWDTRAPSEAGHGERLALGLAGKMPLKAFRVLVQGVFTPSPVVENHA